MTFHSAQREMDSMMEMDDSDEERGATKLVRGGTATSVAMDRQDLGVMQVGCTATS